MDYFLMTLIVHGIIFAFVCKYVAEQRGRDGTNWAVAGFFLGIIALIMLAIIPIVSKELEDNNSKDYMIVYDVDYSDKDSPVHVTKIDFKVINGKVFVAPTFINNSAKNVTAIKAIFYCYNSFGEQVRDTGDILLQDMMIPEKREYTPEDNILVADSTDIRKVDIVVSKVLFFDETFWENKEAKILSNKLSRAVKSNYDMEKLIRELSQERIDLNYITGELRISVPGGVVPEEKQKIINDNWEALIEYFKNKEKEK